MLKFHLIQEIMVYLMMDMIIQNILKKEVMMVFLLVQMVILIMNKEKIKDLLKILY